MAYTRSTLVTQRKNNLLENIERANKLISEYEKQLITEDDPMKREKAEQRILLLREQREKYEHELSKLESIDTGYLVSTGAPEVKHQEIIRTLEVRVEGLEEQMQTSFEEIIDTQKQIRGLMNQSDRSIVDQIVKAIQQDKMSKNEMAETLSIIQNAIEMVLLQNRQASGDLKQLIENMETEGLSSEMSLEHKIEATIPLLPFFLQYKTEFAVKDSVDMQALWDEMKQRWSLMLMRVGKKLWTSEIIVSYGKALDFTVEEVSKDFHHDALLSLQAHYLEFTDFFESCLQIKSLVDQGISKPGTFLRSKSRLDNLLSRIQQFQGEIELTGQILGVREVYPLTELRRLQELVDVISGSMRSAAGLLASSKSVTSELKKIKQTLPITINTFERVLMWLKQTLYLNED